MASSLTNCLLLLLLFSFSLSHLWHFLNAVITHEGSGSSKLNIWSNHGGCLHMQKVEGGGVKAGVRCQIQDILPDGKNYPDGFVDTFFFSLAGETLAAVLLTAHVNTWDIDHLQTTQQSDLMCARHKCWGNTVFPSSPSSAPRRPLHCL